MTSRQLRIRGLESNKDMGAETATASGTDTYITQVPQTVMHKSLSVGKVVKLRKFNATTVKPLVAQTPQHSQNCFPLESLSSNLCPKDIKDIRRLMQHPSTRPIKFGFHNQGSPQRHASPSQVGEISPLVLKRNMLPLVECTQIKLDLGKAAGSGKWYRVD